MKTLLILLFLVPLTAAANNAKKPKAAAPKAAAEASGPVPSRMVTEVEPYVAQLRARLVINGRDRGPFGLHQDISKSTEQLLTLPTRKVEKKTTPFEQVVKAIPIAAVFPLEQEFLVGSRTFRTGQIFPLVAAVENISVRVEAVRSASVRFKNVRTGQIYDKRLDLLPDGVTPGGGSINVPGVTPQRDESSQPLHINILGN